MAYRVADGRMVLFGGLGGPACGVAPDTVLPDTWTWNGSTLTWHLEAPTTSPPARHSQGMAYYAPDTTVMIFGGNGNCGPELTVCGDTWKWNGTNWSSCLGCIPGQPSARTCPAMAFHQSRGRLIMYGGLGSPSLLSDTWQYNGTTWSQLTNVGTPQARTGHRMAYDSNKKAIVMFGGCTANCNTQAPTLVNETWTLDGGAWAVWLPSVRPAARCCVGLAYFAGTLKRVIMFGGTTATLLGAPDMWQWSTATKTWACILAPCQNA